MDPRGGDRTWSRTGRVLAAGVAALALSLAVLPTSGQAALKAISYEGCPYERVGPAESVAKVELDAPAAGDTAVTLESGNPSVATVPSQVTVPNGERSTPIPVTAVAAGQATLFAELAAQRVETEPALKIGDASTEPHLTGLSLTPSSVHPGQSSSAHVVLDFLGAQAGTTVTLASDNPAVTVPAQLVIPHDQCGGTFAVSTTAAATGSADIGATLDVTDYAALTLVPPLKEESGPAPPSSPAPGLLPVGAPAEPTGKRAAALKRCSHRFRHDGAKRAKCRKRARKLPL